MRLILLLLKTLKLWYLTSNKCVKVSHNSSLWTCYDTSYWFRSATYATFLM